MGDFRGAFDAAAETSDGRNGYRYIDRAPILGDSYCVVMFNQLAASDRGKNPVLLRQPIGRDQAPNRLPNHLASRIAEQALGSFIPTRDETVERLAHNGIKRRCHDRCET